MANLPKGYPLVPFNSNSPKNKKHPVDHMARPGQGCPMGSSKKC